MGGTEQEYYMGYCVSQLYSNHSEGSFAAAATVYYARDLIAGTSASETNLI
jgi:hypothetical protein